MLHFTSAPAQLYQSIFVGFGVFPLAAALALILRVALLSDL